MDTSPDLSLKLRRGSSDSRDNFYMDFAQGIDSDIEEVCDTVLQQTTVSSSVVDRVDYSGIPPPPPPVLVGVAVPPLPTLNEHDDLPSPPISPPASAVPPLSPESLKMFKSSDMSPSPPIETEDEGEDVEEKRWQSDKRANKLLEHKTNEIPLFSDAHISQNQFIHSCNTDEEELPQPMQGSTPSISPSPPITPPPCLELSPPPKIKSPQSVELYQIPSFTAPPEYNQYDSERLTSLKEIEDSTLQIPPIPPEFDDIKHLNLTSDLQMLDEKATATEVDMPNILRSPQKTNNNYEDESIVINMTEVTVDEKQETNDLLPTSEDFSLQITDKPQNDICENLESSQSQTMLETLKAFDINESPIIEQLSYAEKEFQDDIDEEESVKDEIKSSVQGSPTSQASQVSQITTALSDYPKRKDSVISIVNGSSASRRSSHEINESNYTKPNSGTGSVVGLPLVSMAISVTPDQLENVNASSSAVKSEVNERSAIPSSLKLDDSILEKGFFQQVSPQLNECLQSPQEGDGAPSMPSPPLMRSPSPKRHDVTLMHSPPKVTSPPKVYSPPLINSPPVLGEEALIKQSEDSSIVDEHPTAYSSIDVNNGAEITDNVTDKNKESETRQVQECTAVPVSTPTVPATYTSSNVNNELRNVVPANNNDDQILLRNISPTLVSPILTSVTNLVTSTEITTIDNVSSLAKLSTTHMREPNIQHHVTIDESTLTGDGGSGDENGSSPPSPGTPYQQQLTIQDRHTNNLNLMFHSSQLSNLPVMPAIKRTHRPSFIYPPMSRIKAGDTLATLFSALYGKLLVVMGIAFPMAEVISTYIPPSFYEVYYLYLYIGSMIFLLFMYATLLWGRPKIPMNIVSPTKSSAKTRSTSVSESTDDSDAQACSTQKKRLSTTITLARRPSLLSPLGRQHHYGSFYLRMGAVAFGIGSMIYSGLEFGQYFELNPDTKCHNVLLALTPATRMAFIFIQMYFIFLNNEQIKVYRYKIIARFGLMHMIGTNLAVWLNVLIQETKHEILTFYNPENRTLRISHRIPGHSRAHSVLASTESRVSTYAHMRVTRGLKGPYQIFECRRTNILGTLVQDASPFLFPCTIEYSLICAAILYVMWKGITSPQTPTPLRPDMITSPTKRSPHHYSVDCARAHRGLFVGILILVLTIISLILFFVLISRPDFVALAVLEVTVCELFIYITATIATLLGMIQIRHLQYDAYRSFSLDDILLVGAQTGSFLYNIFTVIAGHFSVRSDDWLVPINALASIVQTACQTMFILDAGRRQAVMPEHIRKKPGREIVTFMLVVNLAMWAISTLEKSRAESHPIQLNFYGLWAWTIITHVSMPLAIFYRFHSTVCLCEIWKRTYKLKPTYM